MAGITPISQIELLEIHRISNKLSELGKRLEELADAVLRRMAAGAEVDAGDHVAEIVHEQTGGVEFETLVVDGVARYRLGRWGERLAVKDGKKWGS